MGLSLPHKTYNVKKFYLVKMKKKILHFIGRIDEANHLADINLATSYFTNNFDVTVVVASKKFSNSAASEQVIDSILLNLKKCKCKYLILDKYETLNTLFLDDVVGAVFSQAYMFKDVIKLATKKKIKCISYSSNSGTDHHPYGEGLVLYSNQYELNRNKYSLRFFYNSFIAQKKIVGGIFPLENKSDDIYSIYNFDKHKPIACFLVKDISVIRKRINKWFPIRSKMWTEKFISRLELLNQSIITSLKNHGINVVGVSHAASTKQDRYDNITYIDRKHKYDLLRACSFGCSTTSNLTKEFIFYRKPILHVGTDKIPYPFIFPKNRLPRELCKFDYKGRYLNKFNPAWVGEYAYTANNITYELLSLLLVNNYDYEPYLNFFQSFDVPKVYDSIHQSIIDYL